MTRQYRLTITDTVPGVRDVHSSLNYSARCDALFMFDELVHRFPTRFGPAGHERISVTEVLVPRKAARS